MDKGNFIEEQEALIRARFLKDAELFVEIVEEAHDKGMQALKTKKVVINDGWLNYINRVSHCLYR